MPTPDPIIVPSRLPPHARIMFIAEMPGEEEVAEEIRRRHAGNPISGPLVATGQAGYQHTQLCGQAGISRAEAAHANVISYMPVRGASNVIPRIGVKASRRDEWRETVRRAQTTMEGVKPTHYSLFSYLAAVPVDGFYIPPTYWPEVSRLYSEITQVSPHVIILLGNLAAWAVLGKTGIGRLHGHRTDSMEIEGRRYPCFVTYHPVNAARGQGSIPGVKDAILSTYIKAREFAEGKHEEVPRGIIHVPQTRAEVDILLKQYIRGHELVSVDIETPKLGRPKWWQQWKKDFDKGIASWPPVAPHTELPVLSIQLCADGTNAVVIPFIRDDRTTPYWSLDDHVSIVLVLREILDTTPSVFQRGHAFDVPILWKSWGFQCRGYTHDTLIAAHAIDPGVRKGLHELTRRFIPWWIWKGEQSTGAKVDD